MALDTNVVVDLADGRNFAERILTVLREQKVALFITATALVELKKFAEKSRTDPESRRAARALDCLAAWDINFLTADDGLELIKRYAAELRHEGLIAVAEQNDSLILVEAAIGRADYLLTSDHHLLGIDRQQIQAFFRSRHLHSVDLVSPRRLNALLSRI